MSRKTLNLGILAHVDAGKTTLTERLLYAAGVIDRLGSVDAGTTQTDSLALERRRGITIKAAVASFPIGDVTVNLIDTPGHPDFIAEVERVLSVLDGAVLVISAVEGVQPQTQILLRALRRLHIPTLLFISKIDRPGARPNGVLTEIARRLKVAVVALGRVTAEGTKDAGFTAWGQDDADFAARLAESLAERDEELLAAFIERAGELSYLRLRAELAAQVTRGQLHPVFFGSAITGAGIAALMAGLTELLPASAGDPDDEVSGQIFKIERRDNGQKVAYVRMFSGTVRVRDQLSFGAGLTARVTSLAVFERGPAHPQQSVVAGQIAKLGGLSEAKIGDRIGEPAARGTGHEFPAPTLESVVIPAGPNERERLKAALGQIAEQDPLINVRQDDERQELYVSLYGEVQKEVIQATLAEDFGLAVTFSETTMICVERPARRASALEVLQSDEHPYSATIGLRLEPGSTGSGIEFRLDFDPRLVPLFIYKTRAAFIEAMTQYIMNTFEEGLYGWRVTDCIVTMNECGYYVGDGPAKQVLATPKTSAADFRKLTPLVLTEALRQAGTVVCEPMAAAHLEIPAGKTGAVLSALAKLGAAIKTPAQAGESAVIEATLPSASVHRLQEQLPGLTSGEGALETSFGGYEPFRGRPPVR
jgi:ribosomal protection tetracycline resistance protein